MKLRCRFSAMIRCASGSIHVVTKVARLRAGSPSSARSSATKRIASTAVIPVSGNVVLGTSRVANRLPKRAASASDGNGLVMRYSLGTGPGTGWVRELGGQAPWRDGGRLEGTAPGGEHQRGAEEEADRAEQGPGDGDPRGHQLVGAREHVARQRRGHEEHRAEHVEPCDAPGDGPWLDAEEPAR